jgi:N-acetyl-1-D-myo-inositol-2-amino-2-deoxy-alpha-D-glucopyranoside deacetylase/mycothiol S-conjugate amidase
MRSERALLFVGAHPDDESFGPGATLAKYAAEGVRVVYACATRGEAGTVDTPHLRGFGSVGDLRWAELACAAEKLGLAAVVPLGYRDSGMAGAPDNHHPRALVAAPPEEVTRDVVGTIRAVRPQVVITFDPLGGYRHPDHIAIHAATVRAFHAAEDPHRFPGAGPPFRPQKLYFWVPRRASLRLTVRVLRLLGRDPARVGRNRDVDLADIAAVEFPVHARVRVGRGAVGQKHAAQACHLSQLGGRGAVRRALALAARCRAARDLYMRAHPTPVAGSAAEADLFEGVR